MGQSYIVRLISYKSGTLNELEFQNLGNFGFSECSITYFLDDEVKFFHVPSENLQALSTYFDELKVNTPLNKKVFRVDSIMTIYGKIVSSSGEYLGRLRIRVDEKGLEVDNKGLLRDEVGDYDGKMGAYVVPSGINIDYLLSLGLPE